MNISSLLSPTLTSNLNAVQASIVDTQTQLATGKKNLNAAQVGIVTRLSAQVAGYNSVVNNINAGNSVLNVTNTALSSISSIVSQCKDIATQAANAGLTTGDRTALNTTFTQLLAQVTSLITNATVNGDNILNSGGGSPVIQTGLTGASTTTLTNIALNTSLTTALASTVTTAALAGTAIDNLTDALTTVSTAQSTIAATQVGLNAQGSAAASLSTNLQATVDSMQAVDSTALQAKLQSLNNQQSIDYYLVSQMNTAAQAALTIFR
jgi:flagellin-like hook-associated protein FlgL